MIGGYGKMKSIVELIGGLMLLFGGLSTLGLQGIQAIQAIQATQATWQAIQHSTQAHVQTEQAVERRIEQAKTTEEYYDYKEEGERELWEKMKAYYKDAYYKEVKGGEMNEQFN